MFLLILCDGKAEFEAHDPWAGQGGGALEQPYPLRRLSSVAGQLGQWQRPPSLTSSPEARRRSRIRLLLGPEPDVGVAETAHAAAAFGVFS